MNLFKGRIDEHKFVSRTTYKRVYEIIKYGQPFTDDDISQRRMECCASLEC